jgi:hypothetical protein
MVLVVTTVLVEGTALVTAQAGTSLVSQRRSPAGSGTSRLIANKTISVPTPAALRQRMEDMAGTLAKMHAWLKQMRAKAAKGSAEAKREPPGMTRPRLCEAIVEGSARRLRPKLMTFATMSIGLVPILWATGTGSEIMKRIAAPMVGGIVISFILVLLVYPAVSAAWREWSLDIELSPEDNVMAADVGPVWPPVLTVDVGHTTIPPGAPA